MAGWEGSRGPKLVLALSFPTCVGGKTVRLVQMRWHLTLLSRWLYATDCNSYSWRLQRIYSRGGALHHLHAGTKAEADL